MIDLEKLRTDLDSIKELTKSINSPATIDVVEELCKVIHRIAFNLHEAQTTIEMWTEEAGEGDDE